MAKRSWHGPIFGRSLTITNGKVRTAFSHQHKYPFYSVYAVMDQQRLQTTASEVEEVDVDRIEREKMLDE